MTVSQPRVAILLATYNSARFLPEQLESIRRQTHGNWVLLVSDDGSTDGTHALLDQFRITCGHEVIVQSGPRKGFFPNFQALVLSDKVVADYYAFCDHDDIWHDDKIANAISMMRDVPSSTPALYGARTLLVNGDNMPVGHSTLFRRQPSFQNALVQNIAGGNTMLFNHAARDIWLRTGAVDVPAHDWWMYQIVSAAGGVVRYDPRPCLRYRQHGANEIGDNQSLRGMWIRIQQGLQGKFREWNNKNIAALERLSFCITPVNLTIFTTFKDSRRKPPLKRLKMLRQAGVYRQTLVGNIFVFGAALLGKL
ncbi:MAG: glycosyltransferase family 2 protein [Bdellovibrionales bacterium]